jgi:hypothetical protein
VAYKAFEHVRPGNDSLIRTVDRGPVAPCASLLGDARRVVDPHCLAGCLRHLALHRVTRLATLVGDVCDASGSGTAEPESHYRDDVYAVADLLDR